MRRQLLRHTPSQAAVADGLALAAAHDVTVLLTGETGTGKTHLARLIHDGSPRRAEPLLAVHCGALSAGLQENELFGLAKGAFTGAAGPKLGKFEAAGAGTLLLDEIDTLDLEAQAALLRVIETGAFEPVGSNETRRCRARVIAASNWDLERAVREGRFREDLYYRLTVLSFYLPPLRERVRDIEPLARGLVARCAARFGKGLFAVSPEALAALEAFPWPGNIRQLENAVQHAVLRSSGPALLPEHLPEPVRGGGAHAPAAGGAPLPRSRGEYERNVIRRALAEAGGCRSRAAQALGISRGTLYNKMRLHGLHPAAKGAARASAGEERAGSRLG